MDVASRSRCVICGLFWCVQRQRPAASSGLCHSLKSQQRLQASGRNVWVAVESNSGNITPKNRVIWVLFYTCTRLSGNLRYWWTSSFLLLSVSNCSFRLWYTSAPWEPSLLHREYKCTLAFPDSALGLCDPPADRQTPPSSSSDRLVLHAVLWRCAMWNRSCFISSPSRMKTSAIWSRGERSNLRLVMRMASLGGCKSVCVCVCVCVCVRASLAERVCFLSEH